MNATAILASAKRVNLGGLGLGAPLLLVTLLAMLVLPLPPFALDVLFTFNIALSLVVILAAVYTLRPLDFSVFPTVLLITTLLRLALNVASTRVVLLQGHTGHRRCRQGHRGLRRVRHRRQLRRRHRRVRHPGDHQLRRGHQGRGPRVRSQREVHPRRHAGQADGDRRRPERRPDQPGRGAARGARKSHARPTSTAPWTAPANSCAATRSPGILILFINLIGGTRDRRRSSTT